MKYDFTDPSPNSPKPNRRKSSDIPLPLSDQAPPQTPLCRRPHPLRTPHCTNPRQYPRLQRPSPLLSSPKHLNRRRRPRTAHPRWPRNHHLRPARTIMLHPHHIHRPNPPRRTRRIHPPRLPQQPSRPHASRGSERRAVCANRAAATAVRTRHERETGKDVRGLAGVVAASPRRVGGSD